MADSRLFDALVRQDIQELEEVLSSEGCKIIDSYNSNGRTPLMLMAEMGNVEGIQCLAQHGAKLNLRDKTKNTALMLAAEADKLESVKTLINLKALINLRCRREESAVCMACRNGNLEMVKFLVRAGASVEVKSKLGLSPLEGAVVSGNLEMVKFLVESGASLKMKGKAECAFSLACKHEHVDILQYLISKDLDMKESVRLHGESVIDAASNGNEELLKLLLDVGVDLEKFYSDKNALMSSCRQGHLNICKILVKAGANINATNVHLCTPLITASVGGHTDVVHFLLKSNALVDHVDINGETALIVASYHGHVEVVKILLEAGADVNHVTNSGDTALTTACSGNSLGVLSFFLNSRCANCTSGGSISNCKNVLNNSSAIRGKRRAKCGAQTSFKHHCPDINHQNANGQTGLIMLSGCVKYDSSIINQLLECLLNAGADTEARTVGGSTAIEEAFIMCNFTEINFLLKSGANPGRSLQYAISRNMCQLVQSMIENGAVPVSGLKHLKSYSPSQFHSLEGVSSPYNSPFAMALFCARINLAKYFIQKLFFHEHDVTILRYELKKFREYLLTSHTQASDSVSLLDELFSQPWTLFSLSFMAVSIALRFDSSRKARVASTGLPDLLQRRLMFNDGTCEILEND